MSDRRMLLKRALLKEALAGENQTDSLWSPDTPAQSETATSDGSFAEGAEDFGRGASQGASLGFQDEISPLAERFFASVLGDDATKELYDTKSYDDLKNTYRAQNQESAERSPGLYTAGQVTGSIPISLAGSSAGLAKMGLGAAKSAPVITEMLTSGAQGAASGLGYSDGASAEDTLKAMAFGGGMGLAVPGGLAGIKAVSKAAPLQKGVGKISDWLKDKAGDWSFAATGSKGRVADAVLGQGRAREVGRELLDHGVTRFGSSAEAMSDRLGSKLDDVGSALKEIVDVADEVASPENRTTMGALSNQIRSKLGGLGSDASTEDIYKAVERYLKRQTRLYGSQKPLSFAELQKIKSGLSELTNDLDIQGQNMRSNAFKKARHDVKAAQEGGVFSALDQSPNDFMLAPAYKDFKSQWRNLKDASDITGLTARRQAKNRFLSPTDYMAGGIGVLKGGDVPSSLTGALWAGANKVVRERGSAATAVTADTLADMVRSTPEKLGKYAGPLTNALTKGPRDLAVANYVLWERDPEYRKTLEPNNNGNQ